MLKFAKFMATTAGRIIRFGAGAGIIWWGSTIAGTTGVVVMVLGILPIIGGAGNLCLISPFFKSIPLRGKDICALPDAE